MKGSKQSSNTVFPQWVSILLGLTAACMISILISIIGTTIISRGIAGENRYLLVSVICWFVSSFAGCSISALVHKCNSIIVCIITGVAYLLLLIGAQILLFEGAFHNLVIGILTVSAGIILTIYLFSEKRSRKKRKFNYHP